MSVEVGKVVDGKVSGIKDFGAFIQLPDGNTGLVHISEVAEEYIKDIKSHLNENQMVKVKILSVGENGKISLSIKKAIEKSGNEMNHARPERYIEPRKSFQNNHSGSFEDMLSRFIKDSDERMHDIKKNREAKRGSSRR